MEYFADAVFAIAITLPVVHIELPEDPARLGADLAALLPNFVGYALSVLVIGIYWAQHHFSGAIYRTTGHTFLLATVLFLAMIGFIAWPTRLFAEQIAHPEGLPTGARFYAGSLAATALAWWIKWRTGLHTGQVDDRLEDEYVRQLSRKYDLSTLAVLAGALLTWVNWQAGLAVIAIVTLTYVRPPSTPRYVEAAPIVEGEGEE